ncbi:MAG TPA: hypothetical protein P5207_07520, partial [Candidatus Sabulitectum sp.]|nr:hypothetical protein [Candidatus Sabulitectum sp.]
MAFALFGAELPDAGEVPGISGEAVVNGAVIDGFSWVRILETDYAVLRVTAEPAVPMTAYNDQGEPLAVSADGSPMALSAFSDYWFWIRAEGEGTEFTIEYVEPSALEDSQVSSRLTSAEMAEIWTFTAGSTGRYIFSLGGADDISDLDLEIYGPSNSLWAGSYSVNSSEKLSTGLLEGESVQVMISRYNKGGSGEYTLEIERAGDMRQVESGMTGDAISGNVQRFLLPPLEEDSFLELSFQEDGDLDIYVTDMQGTDIASSATYYYTEGVLLQEGTQGVVEVYPYDIGEDLASFPWTISISGAGGELAQGEKLTVDAGYGSSPV